MNTRRLSLLLGITALTVGVLAIVSPAAVPFSPGRIVVSVIGVLALVQAARIARRRHRSTLDEAKTPDPERSVSAPQPGDDFDTVLEQFVDRRHQIARVRSDEGLSAAAVAVLVQFAGKTETEAKRRVKAGTWTDDVYAASFLGGENAPSVPLRDRVWNTLRRESGYQRRIRHTVDAIDAVVTDGSKSTDDTAENRDHDTEATSVPDDDTERQPSTTGRGRLKEGAKRAVARGAHSTGHWEGVSVIALLGIGIGVFVEQPAVVLVGVVSIGYAAYARSSVLPPGEVGIDRELDAESPEPGDEVTITVTVRNTTDRILPDVRVVDGVPAALAVENGSPRCGTALRPAEETTFSYSITATRGVHTFGPTHVIGRNLSGEIEAVRLYSSDSTLRCVPPLAAGNEPFPLRKTTEQFVGREKTSQTGEGIEFSTTREYRPGDPVRRIDWNRRARTRELTTIEFRQERAATVVLLVDARSSAYVAPHPGADHAVDRAVEAAGQLFSKIESADNRVGIAAAGSDSCWLPPSSGIEHRNKARELLATDPEFTPVPKEQKTISWRWRKTLRKRLEPGTQLVFLTPLRDESTRRIARQFDARGHPVTVVSPDSTSNRSAGNRLAGIARTLHVSTLRDAGIPVVDWSWDEPLDVALARYAARRQP
ncbi:hypothetical protein AArcSl_2182 [Halalkaliarchaeum desulfuricum]|uniref:DUF58 domain-containing protein n=1 Tax=Halalkaliarchaeum desulfuricum TaxID=2055893 RepID=A0A343TL35_9EURY|nr:DUF58 domain-containing protein [Halalkaliarchaeum desulfuricum]AUX09807.1 hypothetical protein AArcSl_2182 [Halalkaliarchaeum desulfuricum]